MGRSYGHVLAAFGSQSPQIQYLRALNMPLVFCWLHFICSCRRVDLLVYARHWCRLCLADEHWLCGLRRLSHCQLHSRVRCVRSSAHLRCLNRCLVRCAMCFKRSALVWSSQVRDEWRLGKHFVHGILQLNGHDNILVDGRYRLYTYGNLHFLYCTRTRTVSDCCTVSHGTDRICWFVCCSSLWLVSGDDQQQLRQHVDGERLLPALLWRYGVPALQAGRPRPQLQGQRHDDSGDVHLVWRRLHWRLGLLRVVLYASLPVLYFWYANDSKWDTMRQYSHILWIVLQRSSCFRAAGALGVSANLAVLAFAAVAGLLYKRFF